MLMVKEGGYSLEEVYGRRETRTYTRPPTTIEAIRDADMSYVPFFLAAAAAALAWTGTPAAAAAVVLLALVVLVTAASVAYSNPEPRVEREKLSSPGMSESEVWRRLIMLDELVEYRNNQMDDHTSGGGGSNLIGGQ
jgi:hypothetical protein